MHRSLPPTRLRALELRVLRHVQCRWQNFTECPECLSPWLEFTISKMQSWCQSLALNGVGSGLGVGVCRLASMATPRSVRLQPFYDTQTRHGSPAVFEAARQVAKIPWWRHGFRRWRIFGRSLEAGTGRI